MASNVLVRLRSAWREILTKFNQWKQFTEPCPALVMNIPGPLTHLQNLPSSQNKSLLEQIINNGILWAVPHHRRSIERRLMRKIARARLFAPKKNLIICTNCGHWHEAHTICGNCWNKVKTETALMQEAIQKELQLDPVEKEVIVLYKDDPRTDDIPKNKRLVEMPKERPAWFSKNLLSKVNF